MDQFKKLYHEYCKTYHVEPNELLLGEIQKVSGEDNKTKSLNLSSFNIPEGQCSILGKILTHDFIFTSIHLNDCNLSSDALQALLHGLVTNTTCKTLELKGNGIQGAGTEALAKVLRRNQTLRNLRLEWNQLGAMNSPAFSVFCDALADNKFLIELDLRNNDINHVGASELATALKRNTALRALDLRWNNVGLIGGRALLVLCQTNATLDDLQLVGNNIPDDIMQSIANAIAKNSEQRQMHFGHSQNMAILSRQLQNVHQEKDHQITTTLTRMSLQEQAMVKANKSLTEKLSKLQDALDERKLTFLALSTKHTSLENDLVEAKRQYDDAQNDMKRMEIDKEQLIQKIQREYKNEKDKLNDIQEKLHDFTRKNENLQSTIHELQETIAMNDRTHQIKLTSMEDEIQRLKSKHKEELKDHELIASRDLQRAKEANVSSEQTFKEQITKLDSIRTSLEREINSLKSTISTQKLTHDETLQQEKVRIRNEEEKKQQEIEDRLRTLTSSKEELESRYNQQLITNRELQQKIHFQSIEIETFKRQVDSIQSSILGKDNEILEIREKTKTEYEKKLRSIQKDIGMNDEFKDRIKQLENDLKDQRFTDRHTIRELESRVSELQTTLNQRDQEVTRLKRDEEQRLHFLRSAVIDYIGTGN
ncbi:hypothetical protein I4U23_002345 [Adineta vaga]|nr:hypothetical protein I4U23_002345 [Adineta vaga]